MSELNERYRFFWRHANLKRFNRVTVSVSELRYAHLGMQSHILRKLKKEMPEVVVDHLFFRVNQDGTSGEQFSLNDREHEMQVEYKNKTWPIGVKPQ